MRFIKKQLRFIMLGFFLLTNGVIMAEASLSGGPSGSRSSLVSLFLSIFLNKTIPGPEQKEVFVELMTVTDKDEQVINEGMTYFIPLGITRRLNVDLLPEKATDKGVTWTSSNPRVVDVYPGGLIEARSVGENVTITVTPSNPSARLTFNVTVHEKLAPPTFSASLLRNVIDVDTTTKLDITLTEEAEREYDPYKLTLKSANETIATVNEFGIIKGINPGTTTISVLGHDKEYTITVKEPLTPVIKAETIFVESSETGYVYDKTPLNISFDKENVTDPSVTIVSNNSAIASIIKEADNYFISGTKVAGTATITVYYNSDFLVKKEHTITMVNVLPSSLDVALSKSEGAVGDTIHVTPTLGHNLANPNLKVTDRRLTYTTNDKSLATASSASDGSGRILLKGEGNVIITITSVANPDLFVSVELKITPTLFINDNNFSDFQTFVRKAIGHFLLFFVNGFFGFWTFYLFLKHDRRLLLTNVYSLIVGFMSAALSEIIQYFIPGRSGVFSDVLIDFSGYVVVTLLLTLIVFLTLRLRKKKAQEIAPPTQNEDSEKVA